MPRRPEGARRTESPEVARVRALLDALPRPADQPRQDTGGPLRPGVGRPDGARPPEEGEGLVARCPQEEAGGADSFRRRSRTVPLEWSDAGGRSGSASLPRSVARKFGREPRRFASELALREHLEELCAQTAFERIVEALGVRERSSSELERRLVEEGFSQACAHDAVARARACGLCDDARFAESFIAAKTRAGWGRTRIERALAEQGIRPDELLEDYPEAYFNRSGEQARAWALLLKKGVPDKNPVEKLARFLVAKGYPASLSFDLARKRARGDNC